MPRICHTWDDAIGWRPQRGLGRSLLLPPQGSLCEQCVHACHAKNSMAKKDFDIDPTVGSRRQSTTLYYFGVQCFEYSPGGVIGVHTLPTIDYVAARLAARLSTTWLPDWLLDCRLQGSAHMPVLPTPTFARARHGHVVSANIWVENQILQWLSGLIRV
eukprot:7252599-Pyramimonas_sp.AAC.2